MAEPTGQLQPGVVDQVERVRHVPEEAEHPAPQPGVRDQELRVDADYGLTVLGHSEAAMRFALFVMTPQAQQLIGLYGFTPVASVDTDPMKPLAP